MNNKLLVVEYSAKQKAYHVDFLEDSLRKNEAIRAAGRTVDWVILYCTFDYADAKAFIRRREHAMVRPFRRRRYVPFA